MATTPPSTSGTTFTSATDFSIYDQTLFNTSPGSNKDVDVYVPNSPKLFGANLNVLHTLDTINFRDGTELQQTIAYIKFWGDTSVTPDVVDTDFFKYTPPTSDLSKCFQLNPPEECNYTIYSSDNFSLEDLQEVAGSAIDVVEEIGTIFAEPTLSAETSSPIYTFPDTTQLENAEFGEDTIEVFQGNLDTLYQSLPPELLALIPEPPKPPTILEQAEQGLEVVQDYKNQAEAWLEVVNNITDNLPEELTNLIPDEIQAIRDTLASITGVVSDFLGQIDKYFRIAANIISGVGAVIDTIGAIRDFLDPQLDIPINSPLPGVENNFGIFTPRGDIDGIPEDEVIRGDIDGVPEDEVIRGDIDGIPEDEVLSADITGVQPLTSYDCKKILSKKEGVWQFLFNPQKLDYTYTSDYANADVWATSDGKPIHWKGNTNIELQFNDVILNGYMFGRKVEHLAQGLKDLMGFEKDVTYKGSPPILEFIWGSKRFGPCVMKSLSINETIWDGGELVGATCNFTLVRFPEWVVNDGQVDIFDPSRTPVFIPRDEPLLNDSSVTDPTDEVIGTADPPTTPEPVVTITEPDVPVAETISKDPLCQKIAANYSKIQFVVKNYQTVFELFKNYKGTWGFDKDKVAMNSFISANYKLLQPWYSYQEQVTKEIAAGMYYTSYDYTPLDNFLQRVGYRCDKGLSPPKNPSPAGSPTPRKRPCPECREYGTDKRIMFNPNPSPNYIISGNKKEFEEALTCRYELMLYLIAFHNNSCLNPNTTTALPPKVTNAKPCKLINNTITAGYLKSLSVVGISPKLNSGAVSNALASSKNIDKLNKLDAGLWGADASPAIKARTDLRYDDWYANYARQADLIVGMFFGLNSIKLDGKDIPLKPIQCNVAYKFIKDIHENTNNVRGNNTNINVSQFNNLMIKFNNQCLKPMNTLAKKMKQTLGCK